jgi:outer membrane receptor for ferrienterochelin and colicins
MMLQNYKRILRLVFSFLLLVGLAVSTKAEVLEVNVDEEIDLEEIVVTADAKTEPKESDAPVVMEVITAAELEEANVKTVLEALDNMNGVKAIQSSNTTSWGTNGIQLRGMKSGETLVLIDGQRFHGGHQCVDLSTISIEMVERIEIIKGPASVVYGSENMGGVINIITKKPTKKLHGTFTAGGGTRATHTYGGSAGFGKDKLGAVFNYTYQETDGVAKETDENNEKIFNVSFGYDFNSKSKLEINPYYSKQHYEHDGTMSNWSGRIQERNGLSLNWKYTPDDLSNLYLKGSLFEYKCWMESKMQDFAENYTEAEIGYSRVLGRRHLLTIGAQHYLEEFDLDNINLKYDGDQTNNSFFIQDEMDFAPVQVVLGTRVNRHDILGTKVCSSLGLSYQFNEQGRIRGSIGQAFKTAHMVWLYGGTWRGSGYLIHANPELQPEESIGYQLGMDYRFSKRVSAYITLFRNDVDNLLNTRFEAKDAYWENIEEALIQGVEVNFRAQLSTDLSGSLGYTFLDTENKTTGDELSERPKDRVSVKLNWRAPYGIQVQLSGFYTGSCYYQKMGSNNKVDVKDYWLVNLGLDRKINDRYKVFLKADNLLNVDDIVNEYEVDGVEYSMGMKVMF